MPPKTFAREPNGRLSRASREAIDPTPPAAIRRLRDAALSGMAAPEWGTELGLMYLRGEIAAPLYETGRRWLRLVEAWRHATGCPAPHPRSGANFGSGGKSPEPDPAVAVLDAKGEPTGEFRFPSRLAHRQAEADRAIIDDMAAAHKALAADAAALRAVRCLCEANEAPIGAEGRADAIRGLTVLAVFWGVIPPARKVVDSPPRKA